MKNQFINTDLIKQLQTDNKYSNKFINSTILEYKSRDSYYLKLKNKIPFSVIDVYRLSKLYNVPMEDFILDNEVSAESSITKTKTNKSYRFVKDRKTKQIKQIK